MNSNFGLPLTYEGSTKEVIKGGGKVEKKSFDPSYDTKIFEHVFGKMKGVKLFDTPKETKRKTQKKR